MHIPMSTTEDHFCTFCHVGTAHHIQHPYVNGFRVENALLRHNDLIAFGALGPLCETNNYQRNFTDCGTLFRFHHPEKKGTIKR